MSLDLYILAKKPRIHRGTGVYIRESGETKELQTLEEVKHYFPNYDTSKIKIREYETDEFWSGNITHNLGKMARNVLVSDTLTLYDLLWAPSDVGYEKVTIDYITHITKGYFDALERKSDLELFNPSNGWGNYQTFINFLQSLVMSLISIIPDIKKGEEYTIRSSV